LTTLKFLTNVNAKYGLESIDELIRKEMVGVIPAYDAIIKAVLHQQSI